MTDTIQADLGSLEKILKKPVNSQMVQTPMAAFGSELGKMVDRDVTTSVAQINGGYTVNASAFEKILKHPEKELDRRTIENGHDGPVTRLQGLTTDLKTMLGQGVVREA